MRNISRLILMCCVLVCTALQTVAQFYFYDKNTYNSPVVYEFGGSVGVMNCLTDIGGRKGIGGKFIKDLNFGNTQLNGSLYLSATYKEAFGLRIEGTMGKVKAYDSILKNVRTTTGGRYERNLSFTSTITEVALIAEIHPLFIFINWAGREDSPPNFSPYLLGGIGFFSFNPQTVLAGKTIDLQPLHTEGQGFTQYPDRKPYSLHQSNWLLGVGVKYALSPVINIRAEMLYRILNTDYLDDVSTRYVDPALFAANGLSGTQLNNALLLNDRRITFTEGVPIINNPKGGQKRGNPTNNDAYFNFNIKLGISFGRVKIRR